MRQEVRRFRAKGDDGTIYTVIEYQNFTSFRPMSGPPSSAAGSRELELDNGTPVNFLDEDTFQIFDTEETIRRVD